MSNTNTNIDFTTLNPLINEFVNIYKNNLQPKKASGELINQTKGKIKVNGKWLYVVLTLPEYWKYVEYGRRPGKFPPPDVIKEWIRVKPILPQPYNGKLPTTNQLAYLIGRKIAKKGIPATNILSNTIDEFDLVNKIKNAVTELVNNEIQKEIEDIC